MYFSWWRQMETFCVTGPLWGESTGHGGFPLQRPVTRSFDVSFDLHMSKRLSKQSRRWWFETPSRSSWSHCNDSCSTPYMYESGIWFIKVAYISMLPGSPYHNSQHTQLGHLMCAVALWTNNTKWSSNTITILVIDAGQYPLPPSGCRCTMANLFKISLNFKF